MIVDIAFGLGTGIETFREKFARDFDPDFDFKRPGTWCTARIGLIFSAFSPSSERVPGLGSGIAILTEGA